MIPVVADDAVDPEFGTGAVKVTPAHDPNDFEIGRRHGLPMPSILDEQGRTVDTGTEFDGLDRFVARDAVREALRAQGRIVAEKRPYIHSVGHSSRSGEPIEPRLSLQWFVRVGPLAKASGDAVRDGRVVIHPPELEPRWFDWVDNMHDWCISRQLWWGHRIPVWYSPDGEMRCIGPDEQPPPGWVQDEDVLDTWFSSALWPFSTLGWPDETVDLARYYPTSVLVTGYDILFFWVARMMMFGLYAMATAGRRSRCPSARWRCTAWCATSTARRCRSRRGNTVDPLDWMDRFGADALRFTLARGANPGTDVPIGEDWRGGVSQLRHQAVERHPVRAGQWRGRRGQGCPSRRPADRRGPLDPDRLDAVVAEVDALLEDYQFAKATEALYHFTWDELCDWYLELAKVQLADPATADATRAVLGRVFGRACCGCCTRSCRSSPSALDDADRRGVAGGGGLADADPGQRRTPARRTDRRRPSSWSPSCAGSAPTRACAPHSGCPARLSGVDAVGLATMRAAVRALSRLGRGG